MVLLADDVPTVRRAAAHALGARESGAPRRLLAAMLDDAVLRRTHRRRHGRCRESAHRERWCLAARRDTARRALPRSPGNRSDVIPTTQGRGRRMTVPRLAQELLVRFDWSRALVFSAREHLVGAILVASALESCLRHSPF